MKGRFETEQQSCGQSNPEYHYFCRPGVCACVCACVYVCGGDRTRPMIDIKLDCLSSRKTIKCREEKFFFVLCEGNCYSKTYTEMHFSLTIRFSTTINWFCFGFNKLVLFWLQ